MLIPGLALLAGSVFAQSAQVVVEGQGAEISKPAGVERVSSNLTRAELNRSIDQLEKYLAEHRNDEGFDLVAYQRRLAILKNMTATDDK